MPTRSPQAGEQYGFEVALDACSGCKACVTACHALNGLDEHETWRDVGVLHSIAPLATKQSNLLPSQQESAFLQHVTTACHHCIEPGCLLGCPTNAYEKDPVTGIVRHLDDQCFGCQYCILACPYEVPKYNPRLGIVRKCDMCSQRLAVGEAPACVQACPNHAISIRLVNQAEQYALTSSGELLPTAPLSAITRPTSRYHTSRTIPESVSATNLEQALPQHGHPPLTLMLVLTQASFGTFLFTAGLLFWQYLTGINIVSADVVAMAAAISWLSCAAGLACSTLHLGRPWLAFRAVVGIRHSWLSREAVALGGYFGTLSLFVLPLVVSLLSSVAFFSSIANSERAEIVGAFSATQCHRSAVVWRGRHLLLGHALYLDQATLLDGQNRRQQIRAYVFGPRQRINLDC